MALLAAPALRPRRVAAWVAALVGTGCAATTPAPKPVQKIVRGEVVVTRGVSPTAYEHVARALLYEEEDRLDEAAAELERALTFDGDAPELLAHLAELYVDLDRLPEAAARAQASLDLEPTAEGWLADAAVRDARHDREGAVEALRRAAHLGTEQRTDREVAERAHLALADALLGDLDIDGARETLAGWVRAEADTREGRLRLAAVSWAEGRLADAETALREVLEDEPELGDALITLGQLLVAQGRAEEAKVVFRTAIDRSEEPDRIAEGYLRWLVARGESAEAARVLDGFATEERGEEPVVRAALERAAGRPARGKALAEKAAKHADDPGPLLVEAGLCAEEMDDARAALSSYQGVRPTSSAYVQARLHAAALLRFERKWDAAARALAEAEAAAKPEQADDVTLALAQLDEDRGQAEAAVARLARADDSKKVSRLALARAAIEERRGAVDAALAITTAYLDADPLDPGALNFAAFVAADHERDAATALKRARASFALEPGSGAVLDTIGWSELKVGHLDRAGSYLEQAARIEPGDPEILGHLGDLYAKRADPRRAADAYRKALALSPDETLRKKLRKRLSTVDKK